MSKLLTAWQEYQKYKKLTPAGKRIVIFSESYQDWHHFEPLVTGLTTEFNQEICYVSSDPSDPGLATEHPLIHAFYIPEGIIQIIFFQFLDAELMILTMMDLNNYELKRSIHPIHYVYLFHSLASTHMVDHANSYDHYDTLLCTGPHQVREIRAREKQFGLKPKNLIPYGYHRLDALMNEKVNNQIGQISKVLLAPTWGDNSILNLVGLDLCQTILDGGHFLTVRPHYETVKRTPDIIDEIKHRFQDHSNFNLVLGMGENRSLLDSNVLITDWSGISFEYSMGLEKPVIFIDVPPRIRNPDWQELQMEPLEVSIRDKVGRIVALDEIYSISETINQMLSEKDQYSLNINKLRDEWVYNLSQTRSVGAKEIVKLLKQS
ncbi:MAG TPA: CDP-glycerol glycerophosphotransferase family protein [Gammaproteobacteria bacterium]|nr:CDP-glycerol glycerophosphotransferase family protein [Gammaproteobacteria bacterium]HJP43131.1 CDP-glycerol glycerophosphotransferase family protein [Gammaproteobacteria bacterium]